MMEPESLTEEYGHSSSTENNASIARLFSHIPCGKAAQPQEQLPCYLQDVTFDQS